MSKKRVMKRFEVEVMMTATFTVWGDTEEEVSQVFQDENEHTLFMDSGIDVRTTELPRGGSVADGVIYDGEWIQEENFSDECGESVSPTDDPAYLQPGTAGYLAHMESLGQQRLFNDDEDNK